MILRTALAAAFLLNVSAAFADGHFERTLSVSPQPDLYVSTGAGRIHIVPGSGSQIHITAHLHAGWSHSGDLDQRIRRIESNPPIEQSGNSIRVGFPSTEDRPLYNNITIDYEISAPPSVALNLHTGSGDIETDNLGRFLKANSGSGSVRAHGLAGTADLQTGSGDVELEEQAAGDVRAHTGSGSVRIHGLKGGLDAHTGSGNIEADGTLAGSGDLRSGSGSIRLHLGRDARLDVDARSGSGTIRVAQTQDHSSQDRHHLFTSTNGGGQSLRIITGSGDIEIN